MNSRKLASLVLVLGLTGCGSALEGAGVVGNGSTAAGGAATVTVTSPGVVSVAPARRFGGTENLLPNGSFERGVLPWVPFTGSKLALTHSVHRFGRLALLARPKTKRRTSLGAAIVDVVSRPAHGSRYSFSTWLKASPRGGLATVALSALNPHDIWVPVGPRAVRPVTGGWQHLTVHGTVRIRNSRYLRATVSIKNISLGAWLAIDGVEAKILSAG